ncbi:hypothetical protein HK28_13895 [Acetobacter sp. DsW_063]|nr:hypothetical protein HK28_13895 [Acetobacter sp. DsW_063]
MSQMMNGDVPVHPVQNNRQPRERAVCPVVVTLAVYEVYSHVFSPQERLITGECRGGFGVGELIAFLYARSFPKSEWRKRTDEAFKGMRL